MQIEKDELKAAISLNSLMGVIVMRGIRGEPLPNDTESLKELRKSYAEFCKERNLSTNQMDKMVLEEIDRLRRKK